MNEQITIALYDTDDDYILGFNEYLRDNESEKYVVFSFNEESKLIEFCDKFEQISIIVVAEYCVNENLLSRLNGKKIIISEEKNVISICNLKTVYRYQKAESLICNIINYCAEECEYSSKDVYVKKKTGLVIGIYSPINRCGKTNLGIKLTKKLFNEKSVFISLEEFSGLKEYLNIEYDMNVSDLLYFFLQEKENISIKTDAIVRNFDGIDIIPPVSNIGDLGDIDAEVWINLITELKNTRKYGYIVIDCSNAMADIFDFLQICDVIIVPFINDVISACKINEFNKFIEVYKEGILKDKIYNIEMMESREEIDKKIEKIIDCINKGGI